jgi:two-component system, OmpR family, KDP operon response regulator KdpE
MIRVALVSDRWLSPEAWEGRGMTVTRPGSASFERLVAEKFGAVLLDWSFPDDGALANYWQLHNLLGVPLVVLAEGAASGEVKGLLDRGADDVVTGSVDGALLAARVAAIVRRTQGRGQPQVSATLSLSGIEVDLAQRMVRRPDGAQTLSRTEYALLEAFLAARGRACSHRELVSRVWGGESASATHYLRLYVRYLRQKLELDPAHPKHLVNVRGVGYRLVLEPSAELARTEETASGGVLPEDVGVAVGA